MSDQATSTNDKTVRERPRPASLGLSTTHVQCELYKRESYMFINLTGVYYDKSQSNSYHCSIFRRLLGYLALNQHSLSVIPPSVSSLRATPSYSIIS